MNTTDHRNRIVVAALLSGGLAVAGLALGAGIAQADRPSGPYTWCPGQSMDRGGAMGARRRVQTGPSRRPQKNISFGI